MRFGVIVAVGRLISSGSPIFRVDVLSIERGPISVERTDQRIKFSGPVSAVEIEKVDGLDGKPIRLENLPFVDLADYIQYKSVRNGHDDAEKGFRYSGTNGFTWKVDAQGETESK